MAASFSSPTSHKGEAHTNECCSSCFVLGCQCAVTVINAPVRQRIPVMSVKQFECQNSQVGNPLNPSPLPLCMPVFLSL